MKAFRIILFAIFLLSCQIVFAQTLNSSVTIKINRGKYIVSGVVTSSEIKNEVIDKVKRQFGNNNADFGKINVQSAAKPFQNDWQTEFDKSLLKIKSWKSGVIIFSNVEKSTDKTYPRLPEVIVDTKFLLSDGQLVSLGDYKDKLVVLLFAESWCVPCIGQIQDLKEFYASISTRNIEMVVLSVETSPKEKKEWRETFERNDFRYKFGWANLKVLDNFSKFSKLNAIPQAFIILNGRLHGVFTGGNPKVTEKFKETILKTLDENNL